MNERAHPGSAGVSIALCLPGFVACIFIHALGLWLLLIGCYSLYVTNYVFGLVARLRKNEHFFYRRRFGCLLTDSP